MHHRVRGQPLLGLSDERANANEAWLRESLFPSEHKSILRRNRSLSDMLQFLGLIAKSSMCAGDRRMLDKPMGTLCIALGVGNRASLRCVMKGGGKESLHTTRGNRENKWAARTRESGGGGGGGVI